MRIIQDYLRQTGDIQLLDQVVNNASVIDCMKDAGRELIGRFRQEDGLLDFGAGSNPLIEIRTDGYQHIVPAANGLAASYLLKIAQWCRERSDSDSAQFQEWADQIQKSMSEKLWNEKDGWFYNLHADGRKELVWTYHLFDLLDRDILSLSKEEQLVSHITEGEFLGPYGMYSISKQDRLHWDFEDVDWGGGGQYVGMPLRIAESLFRLGYYNSGWSVLSRCKLWSDRYPYLPQEIFTDLLRSPEVVEMSLEVSAGSGVQAILFGVFGLRPQKNGSLEILPSYNQMLGHAKMTGYRFRGHCYDVVMEPLEFRVYRDGELVTVNPYGKRVCLK
jgi:glycogen debranching enzyme